MEWGQFGGRVGLYLWGEPFSGRRQSSGQGLLVGGDNSVDSATAWWASQAQDTVGRFQKMRTKNPDCVPV